MAGNATIDAAKQLMDAMRKEDGTYRTHSEMVAEGIPTKYTGHYDQFNIGLPPGLDPNTGEGEKNPTYMYGVNVALVEVDVKTGKTQVAAGSPGSATWAWSATCSPWKARATAASRTPSASR